ncbi:MAG: Glycine--tRNA ligase beta subunit [candidate division BRC1 bacterium ADurb.BinA364]|nr:MAG: Glycine--tRNA ligase beta subunit [candidate division BRC1 bacterium ADurb.BinA364]
MYAIAEALRREWTLERIADLTKWDAFFVRKINNIVKMEKELAAGPLTPELIRRAKRMGFQDESISKFSKKPEASVRQVRMDNGILPTYKMVDTCAAEFAAQTPYFYSTYGTECEVPRSDNKKVIIVGAGPIRIGQGIEFDYCCVHGVMACQEAGIVLSVERRREAIWAEARRLAAQAGGRLPEETRGALLAEVANLVESPTPLLGAFEEQYLELPREVLATVMRKHQRYFPIENEKGELLPRFVAVANGRIDPAAVRAGNEAVLRARYADAAFFWQHDIAKTLEEFRPALSGLMFQAKLGSMLDKSERIEQLAPALADWLGLSAAEKAAALRAAHLAKADLVTQMVIELTSLAGQMGRRYALKDGEPPEVAEAIFECALPRFAGDALPRTKAGATVALADRLDSLAGLFAVGLAPRSAADPFALRRAALGIVQTLIENGIDLDLRQALRAAAALQPVEASEQCQAEALEFIARRLEQWWLDGGARHDLVRAVLAERGHNPAGASRLLDELAAAAPTERFGRILTAYSRPARIVRGQTLEAGGRVDPALFEQDEEKALHAACETAAAAIRPAMRLADFLDAFEPLCEPIGKFFDEVFVMVEDERIKANRLALLKRIADLAGGIADFSKIEGF